MPTAPNSIAATVLALPPLLRGVSHVQGVPVGRCSINMPVVAFGAGSVYLEFELGNDLSWDIMLPNISAAEAVLGGF